MCFLALEIEISHIFLFFAKSDLQIGASFGYSKRGWERWERWERMGEIGGMERMGEYVRGGNLYDGIGFNSLSTAGSDNSLTPNF